MFDIACHIVVLSSMGVRKLVDMFACGERSVGRLLFLVSLKI